MTKEQRYRAALERIANYFGTGLSAHTNAHKMRLMAQRALDDSAPEPTDIRDPYRPKEHGGRMTKTVSETQFQSLVDKLDALAIGMRDPQQTPSREWVARECTAMLIRWWNGIAGHGLPTGQWSPEAAGGVEIRDPYRPKNTGGCMTNLRNLLIEASQWISDHEPECPNPEYFALLERIDAALDAPEPKTLDASGGTGLPEARQGALSEPRAAHEPAYDPRPYHEFGEWLESVLPGRDDYAVLAGRIWMRVRDALRQSPAEPSSLHHCETCQCPEIEAAVGMRVPEPEAPRVDLIALALKVSNLSNYGEDDPDFYSDLDMLGALARAAQSAEPKAEPVDELREVMRVNEAGDLVPVDAVLPPGFIRLPLCASCGVQDVAFAKHFAWCAAYPGQPVRPVENRGTPT